MNLSELRTFLAVVDTGNLNRAAEHLNVTQSTVYARLNNLEEELGQSLIHRRKSGAQLTSAGFRFERYAQLMTDLWRQAQQEAALPPEIDSVCNIGCHDDLWTGMGEHLFNRIRETGDSIASSAWQANQADIDRWLVNDLIDVAICFGMTLQENWTVHSLGADRLVLVSSTPRGLMRWDPNYIYVDHGETFRKNHAATYPDGDTPTVTFGSSRWALQFLLENGGSGYIPERLVQSYIENGTMHRVPGAAVFNRPVYLVVNNGFAESSPWFTDVLNLMQKQ